MLASVVNLLKRYFGREAFMTPGGYREIWHIAYPLIMMSATQTLMMFVDRKMLASHSTDEMAAALPAGILYFTLFCFFSVTANFTSALVAQFYGNKERFACVKSVWSGVYLAVVFSLLIIFVNPLIGEFLLYNTEHDAATKQLEVTYFHSLLFSGVFGCLAAPFFGFFSGRGKTMPVAVINIIGGLLNIVLDYLLIFGISDCCGFSIPELGIWGAGIATTISMGCTFGMIFLLFIFQNQKIYATRKWYCGQFEYILKLFRYGTPSGLQVFFDVGSFTFIILLLGNRGPVVLAASTAALSINNIFFTPLMGLSDTTAIVNGQYIGRKEPDYAQKSTFSAWRIAFFYMIGGAILYCFFPGQLINFFAPDEVSTKISFDEVLRCGSSILLAVAIFNFFDATKYIFMGAMRGAGDTLAIMLINISCVWGLMVPGIYFISANENVHILLIWFYMALCGGIEAFIIYLRYRSGAWRKIKLTAHSAAVAVEKAVES